MLAGPCTLFPRRGEQGGGGLPYKVYKGEILIGTVKVP